MKHNYKEIGYVEIVEDWEDLAAQSLSPEWVVVKGILYSKVWDKK